MVFITFDTDGSTKPTRRIKSHTKVRTGCLTCKKRHVKCDETKPKCQKCIQNGYICDGYPSRMIEMVIKTKEPVSQDLSSRFLKPHENMAFQYFLDVSVGFFSQDKVCAGFWNPLVLQDIHHEPIVKNLALAIGSIQRLSWDKTCDRIQEENFAITYYEKALGLLNRRTNADYDLILTCCLLFCIIEAYRRRDEIWAKHIELGTRVLSEFEQKAKGSLSLVDQRVLQYLVPTVHVVTDNPDAIRSFAHECVEQPDQAFENLVKSKKPTSI